MTLDLVKAGADLEAKTYQGATSICLAADKGHAAVIRALMEAGADPNNPRFDGAKPVFFAAWKGQVDAIRELLRGTTPSWGESVPLEAAAEHGHAAAAVELIQQLGLKGAGGPSGGVEALGQAAQNNRVGVLAVLTEAGVVDTGRALTGAAIYGQEAAVKYLLREQERSGKYAGGDAYPDAPDAFGRSPLICCMVACRPSSPRIVRLLVDAGANTALTVRDRKTWGGIGLRSDGTPLGFVTCLLRDKRGAGGEPAAEAGLHTLEAIRRLLLQVGAARADSFSWPTGDGDGSSRVGRAGESARRAKTAATAATATATVAAAATTTTTTPTPLALTLPILRRRTARRGVLLMAMFRWGGGRVDR